MYLIKTETNRKFLVVLSTAYWRLAFAVFESGRVYVFIFQFPLLLQYGDTMLYLIIFCALVQKKEYVNSCRTHVAYIIINKAYYHFESCTRLYTSGHSFI